MGNNQAADIRDKAAILAAQLPKLLMKAQQITHDVISGEHQLRSSGVGQDFWQFRDYNTHDDAQHIDWRQSAKSDQIVIREHERQTRRKFAIWTDLYQGMHWASNNHIMHKIEVMQIIALAAAMLVKQSGESFYIHHHNHNTARQLEHMSLDDFASFMILQSLDNDLPATSNVAQIYEMAPLKQGIIPILLGDFLSPFDVIESSVIHLANRSDLGMVIQILDPAEIDLSYHGRVEFHDISRPNHKILIENVAQIGKDYRQKIIDHQAKIQQLCNQYNWRYICLRTDQSLSKAMAQIWELLMMNHFDVKRM